MACAGQSAKQGEGAGIVCIAGALSLSPTAPRPQRVSWRGQCGVALQVAGQLAGL